MSGGNAFINAFDGRLPHLTRGERIDRRTGTTPSGPRGPLLGYSSNPSLCGSHMGEIRMHRGVHATCAATRACAASPRKGEHQQISGVDYRCTAKTNLGDTVASLCGGSPLPFR